MSLRGIVKGLLVLGQFCFLSTDVQAQPGLSYAFSQSAGTYTPITGGTVLISGTRWNGQRFTVNLPAPFVFDGQPYTLMYVNCDGFITFGAQLAGTTKPLSSNGAFAGAISPFGANLEDANLGSSEIRWAQVASEVVVQWRDTRRKFGGNTESFSFQARMNLSTGVIRFVYGPVNNHSANTREQPEVGLRGSSNIFPTFVNNRTVGIGLETWATSLPGTANNSAMRYTAANPAKLPATGQTYTFTPVPLCPPTVNVTADPGATICAGTPVTFTATGTNGGAAPTYAWTLNGNAVGTGSTYSLASPADGDVVSATMTSTAPCAWPLSVTSSVTMTVNPLPSVTLSGNAPICVGTTALNLTYNGASNGPDQYDVDWNPAANAAGFTDIPWSTLSGGNMPLTGLANAVGDHQATIRVRNSSTGCSNIVSTSVVCGTANENGTVSLTAPNNGRFIGVNFASYGRPGGNCGNFTMGTCHAPISLSVVQSAALGQRTVSIPATNAAFGGDPCIGTNKRLYVELVSGFNLHIDPMPGTAIAGPSSICVGSTAMLTAPVANAYSWSTGATTPSITVTPVATTTYSVGLTNGACSATASHTVTVSPTPTITLSSPLSTICSGTTSVVVPYTGTTGSPDQYAIDWSNAANTAGIPDVGWSTLSSGAITSPVPTSTSGTYSASILLRNSALGCTGSTSTGTVCGNVNENQTLTMNAPAGSRFSEVNFASYGRPTGSCGAFALGACHASGSLGVVSSMALGNAGFSIGATNAIFGDPCVGTAKRLYVQATHSAFSLRVTPASAATIGYTGSPYCRSVATASITFAGTTGGAFSSTPGLVINGTTGTVTPTASTPGTYTVTYSLPSNGACPAFSTTTTITIVAAPAATIDYIGSPYCGSAGAASVIRSGTAGGVYTSSTGLSINGATGAVDLSASTAGTYTVTYAIAAGTCPAFSTNAAITVHSSPTASAAVSAPVTCFGGNATVTVSASGGTAPFVGTGTFARAAGTYSFTVTDANGCSSTASTSVDQPTALDASASLVMQPTGCNTNDAEVEVTASGGTPMYMGIGNFNGLAAGPQSFVVKDAAGCQTTVSITILEPDGDGDGTVDCADGCPGDATKTAPGACGCNVPDTDSDGDSSADCVDTCPADPLKTAPGQCGCGAVDSDTDGDGLMDCVDPCPSGANPGSACNDGDPNTINDVIGNNCLCQGTPTEPWLILSITTDDHGEQTAWEIVPLAGGAAIHSGSGYASNSTYTISCPLPAGSYQLRVTDSAGDGMCCLEGNGGYVLRMSDGRRIIDNANDGAFTLNSSVALGFNLPLGIDRLTPSRCDRVNYLPSDFVQAVPNSAVRAQHNTGAQNDDGYQFWFFNPDGGYSRRIMITHAYNNWWFPVGADRCSYLKLDNIETNQLPANTLLNVRVRSMVNGVFSAFGPTCRFKIDLAMTCPTTQLIAELTDPHLSCGIENVLLNGSTTLYSIPVASANRYAWEFSKSGYLRRITSAGSTLNLITWATSPLEYNSMYNVRVCPSFDNGANYCPYGPSCTISTGAPPQSAGRGMEERSADAVLSMWPNPNVGDLLHVQVGGLADVEREVAVGVYSLTGKLMRQEILLGEGTTLNASIALPAGTPPGIYIVSLSVDGRLYSDRLIVQ